MEKEATRKNIALLALVFLISMAVYPSYADVTTNIKEPIVRLEFVPWTNGGLGEPVLLTGNLHMTVRTTADGNGGYHVGFHNNPQGITGIGVTEL